MAEPATRVDTLLAAALQLGADPLDGQLLLQHAWDGRADLSHAQWRAWLHAHGDEPVPAAIEKVFLTLVQRRVQGEPVAYLTGLKEFYGLALQVDRRVLVPRPDTELLVDWALEQLAALATPVPDRPRAVLDLGTGSGAVALAIKHTRPDAHVDAVDASADALAVAQRNADRLGLTIGFLQGHWLEPVTGRYDCIVSNPPYVAAGDPHLPALRHEPLQALVAGADGLQDLRAIVPAARAHLQPGGWLLVEHGFDQGLPVRQLFMAAGFVQIATRRDLAGHERCTGGRVIAGGAGAMVK